MVNKIQREAEFWLEDWRTEKCQEKKIWEDTVSLKAEEIRKKYLETERRFMKECVEPKRIAMFNYEIGNYKEINNANKWKRNVIMMEKQRKVQDKKSYMQEKEKGIQKGETVIVLKIRPKEANATPNEIEKNWKVEIQLVGRIKKWDLNRRR
jgi:hypothetical protein